MARNFFWLLAFSFALIAGLVPQTGWAQETQLRKWTDASGKYELEASLAGVAGGMVSLRKADGTVVAVEVARLSEADQRFLQSVAPGPVSPAGGRADGWVSWRGPNADGTSNETGLATTFPSDGPKELWRVPLGSGFSGLTVSGNRLYTLYGDGSREFVACFDADTGEEVWKVDSDVDFSQGRSFGPRATPCLDGEHLFSAGASGRLMCLKAADGGEIWSMNLYEKFGMRLHDEGLSPSPQIDGERLIVAGGNSVFALNKANGEVIWRALEEKINHSTPRFAALGGKRQLLVLSTENLVSLDPEDGGENWRAAQRGVNCATPVVGPDDHVFTAAAYGFGCQLLKVSGDSAEQVYQNNALATHHATALLHEGYLYGFHDRIGILRCVELATGEEKWETRGPGKGKMIMADGQMINLSENGTLALAPPSPDGYQPTAEATNLLKGISYTAPTLVAGKLYLRSNEEMVCVDLRR